MKIKGRIVVVTGGADGIGKGLCERFAAEGAKKIIVLDRNGVGAKATADAIGGVAYECDVAKEDQIKKIVDEVEKNVGPISIFVSNAGIGDFGGRQDDATSQPNDQWQRGWDVNVMAHVYAARACLPYMIPRGERTVDYDHLIDIQTGRVIEFRSPEIEELQRKMAERLGYRLIGHRLELFGVPSDDTERRGRDEGER